MKFYKNPPKKSGHCWYVDKEYPIPKIGYYLNGILHDNSTQYNTLSRYTMEHIRFGDLIMSPDCNENIIE